MDKTIIRNNIREILANSQLVIDIHDDCKYSTSKPEYEMELRFDSKRVDKKAFKIFFKEDLGIIEETVSNVIVATYDNLMGNKIRIIHENDNEIFMKKEKILGPIRILDELPVRYTLSTERILDNISKSGHRIDAKRIRRRKQFEYIDSTNRKCYFTCFFTIVNDEEYEIEIELDIRLVKEQISDVDRNINSLVNLILWIYRKFYSYNNKEDKVYRTLNTMKNSVNFNMPGIFDYKRLMSECTVYITHKLDGERCLLMSQGKSMFRYNRKGEIFYAFDISTDIGDTILDAEYYDSEYYIFDILYYMSNDIRDEPFNIRMEKAIDISETINVQFKAYMKVTNYDSFHEALMEMYVRKSLSYTIDGIIVVPSDMKYKETRVMKWKKEPTIDFKIRDRKLYYLSNGIYDLCANISIDNYKHSMEEKIGEFVVRDNVATFMRYRNDKTYPNDKRFVERTLNMSRTQTLTLDDMLCNTPFIFRNAFNAYKRKIIGTMGGICLDIGSGKGSDIGKFMHHKDDNPSITKLYCIEPDRTNFSELCRRIRNHPHKKRIISNVFSSLDKEFFLMSETKFDHVTIFLVINRMTLPEISQTIENIKIVTKINSKVHIIFMSTDRIKRYMDINNSKEINECGITLRPNFQDKRLEIDMSSPTVSNIREYLVDEKAIIEKFGILGFKIEHQEVARSNYYMSKLFVDLMGMYKYLRFNRIN